MSGADISRVASHISSVAPAGESSATPLSGGKKLLSKPLKLKPQKPMGGSVFLMSSGSSGKASKVMLMKQPPKQTASEVTSGESQPVSTPPSKKPSMRPAAWLLHSTGLRMVRELVYGDLIEVQEEKDSEGLLSANEQKQLGRLQTAFTDLKKQNRPFTVRSKYLCRCGFATRSRHELELHRDYGSISLEDFRYIYNCCLCNVRNVRSPMIMAAHIERSHGRSARMHTVPLTGFCPYCPYEQRTVTKVKLSRHVINCAITFRIDCNLAPIATDANIPLFEVVQPPTTSVQATTAAASVAGSIASSSLAAAVKASSTSTAQAQSNVCTTVSAAGPVMTPAESPVITTTTTTGKTALAKLARLAPLPEGLGFEVCEVCGAFLASRESLMLHMTHAHKLVLPDVCRTAEKPIISCDKCMERFWTGLGLSVHQREMHGGKLEPASPPTTVCPLCHRTRLSDVVEHLARQHRITLVDMFAQRYCSVCQLSLHSARSFELHMLTRHADLFPDRAALYAAIVLVDRATRGRVGMVGRGRQLSVLSGASLRPGSEPGKEPGPRCPVCGCELADDDQVAEHVRRSHRFICSHCDRKCGSTAFLSHHVQTCHSTDSVACELCGLQVAVLSMPEHLRTSHVQSCAISLTRLSADHLPSDQVDAHVPSCVVTLTPIEDDLMDQGRKRRHGSTSSGDSVTPSSNDEDDDDLRDCTEVIPDETRPAAKKLKPL